MLRFSSSHLIKQLQHHHSPSSLSVTTTNPNIGIPKFNQDLFWNWCADRGVTCRRPLEITPPTSQTGRSLVLSAEGVLQPGSVIAAIPYQSAAATTNSPTAAERKLYGNAHTSISTIRPCAILNAETIPLGCVPPLHPFRMFPYWESMYKKFSKKSLSVEQQRRAIPYRMLMETFGEEEERFLWLATVLAFAACDSQSPLYRHYSPYFDLIFSSVNQVTHQKFTSSSTQHQESHHQPSSLEEISSNFSSIFSSHQRNILVSRFLSQESKPNERDEYLQLEQLHKMASQTISRKITKVHSSQTSRKRMKELHSTVSVSNNSKNNEHQGDVIDHLPGGNLVFSCLMRILSHSITLAAGCPPTEQGQDDETNGRGKNQQNAIAASFFHTRNGNYLSSSAEQNQRILLPSLIPIVDLLNHSDTPNCDVVCSKSRTDGLSRVVIVSRGAIDVNEPLTIGYNVYREKSRKFEDDDDEETSKALSLFRFGF